MSVDMRTAGQVRAIMASTFDVDEDDLPEDASTSTCSRWDSLYHLTLLLALEEQFGVTFSMDEMPEMTSLQRIVATLNHHGVGEEA